MKCLCVGRDGRFPRHPSVSSSFLASSVLFLTLYKTLLKTMKTVFHGNLHLEAHFFIASKLLVERLKKQQTFGVRF